MTINEMLSVYNSIGKEKEESEEKEHNLMQDIVFLQSKSTDITIKIDKEGNPYYECSLLSIEKANIQLEDFIKLLNNDWYIENNKYLKIKI